MPSSYDDFVKIVTRLDSVVNNLLAAIRAAGSSWNLIAQLGKALSALLNEAERVDPGDILFVPIWQEYGQVRPTGEAGALRAGTVSVTVFPARHAGLRSGGMGTVSDDIGRYESTHE